MFNKAKLNASPSDAQAKEKLAMYVYEYLIHTGAQKAASQFLSEIRWEKQLPVGESPGFLVQWWSVFYDLYSAAPERRETHEHSNEAKAFHDYGFVNSCYPNGMAHGPGPMPMPGPPDGSMMPGSVIPPGFFPGPMMDPRLGIPMGHRLPGGSRFPGNMPPPFMGPMMVTGPMRGFHPGSGPSPRLPPPNHHAMMPTHSIMPPGGGNYSMSPGPQSTPPHMAGNNNPMSNLPPMMTGHPHSNNSQSMNSMLQSGCGSIPNGPSPVGGIMHSPQDGSTGAGSSMDGMMLSSGPVSSSSAMRMNGPNNGHISSGLMGPPIAPVSSSANNFGLNCAPDDLLHDVTMMSSSSGMPHPSSQMMMLNGNGPHPGMMMSGPGGPMPPQHHSLMLPPDVGNSGMPPDHYPNSMSHPSHMMMSGPMSMMGPNNHGPPLSMSSHHPGSLMPPSSKTVHSQAMCGPSPHSLHNNNCHSNASGMGLADPDNAAILKIKEQMQEDVEGFDSNFEAEYFSNQPQ